MKILRHTYRTIVTAFLSVLLCLTIFFGVAVPNFSKKEKTTVDASITAIFSTVAPILTTLNGVLTLSNSIYKGAKAASNAEDGNGVESFFKAIIGGNEVDTLNDISEQLTHISGDISEIKDKMDSVSTQLSSISGQLDSIVTSIQNGFNTTIDKITVNLYESQLELRNWSNMSTQINNFYTKYASVKTTLSVYMDTINSNYADYLNFLQKVYSLDNGDAIKSVLAKISINYDDSYNLLSTEEQNLLATSISYNGKTTSVGKYISDYISFMTDYTENLYSNFKDGFSTDMYVSLIDMADYILGNKSFLDTGIGEVFYRLSVMGYATDTEVHKAYNEFMADVLYDFMLTAYMCNMSLNMQINKLTAFNGNVSTISTYEKYVENINALIPQILAYTDYEYQKCVKTYDVDGFTPETGYTTNDYVVYYGNSVNYVSSGDRVTRYVLKKNDSLDSIVVNRQYLTLAAGENFQAKIYYNGSEIQNNYEFISSNSEVAYVSSTGLISAISAGDCTVGVQVNSVYYPLFSVSVSSAYVYSNGTAKNVYTTTQNGSVISYELNGDGLTYDYDANIRTSRTTFNTDSSHILNLKVALAGDDVEDYTFSSFNSDIVIEETGYALVNRSMTGSIVARKTTDGKTTVIIIPVTSTATQVADTDVYDVLTVDAPITAENTCYIYTKEDLVQWNYNYRRSSKGQNVVLMNDIDFEWDEWVTLESFRADYKAAETVSGYVHYTAVNYTFDGNGHTIRNITFGRSVRSTSASNTYNYGLFVQAAGTIKNLNIENVTYTTEEEDASFYENKNGVFTVFATNSWTNRSNADDTKITNQSFSLIDCSISGTIYITAAMETAVRDITVVPFTSDEYNGTYNISRCIFRANLVIDANGNDINVTFKDYDNLSSTATVENIIFAGAVHIINIKNNSKVSVNIDKFLYVNNAVFDSTNTAGEKRTIALNGTLISSQEATDNGYWTAKGFSEDLYMFTLTGTTYPRTMPILKSADLYAYTDTFQKIYYVGDVVDTSNIKVYEGSTDVTSKGKFSSVDLSTTGTKSLVFTYGNKSLSITLYCFDAEEYPVTKYTILYSYDSYSNSKTSYSDDAYEGCGIYLADALYERENYHQIGWKIDGTNITYCINALYIATGDVTFVPVWCGEDHTITFPDASSSLYEETGSMVMVKYNGQYITSGTSIPYNSEIKITFDVPDGYDLLDFSITGATRKYKSDNTIYKVTGDVVITYTLEAHMYYVYFYDNDTGKLLGTSIVSYGATPTFFGTNNGIPKKNSTAQYSYTFDHWDRALSPVTGETSYYAIFNATVNQYTYTFYNDDGKTVLKSVTADYGTVIEAPVAVKDSDLIYKYYFVKWMSNYENGALLMNDVSYVASYQKSYIEYSLTIPANVTITQNGKELTNSYTVHYGDIITITRKASVGHTETGFEVVGATLTDDETYQVTGNVLATYSETANIYTVNFYNEEVLLDTIDVEYGGVAVYTKEEPQKTATQQYTYHFDDWDKPLYNITENTNFYAQFHEIVNQYTYTFLNDDGTLLKSETVDYGTVIVSPENPVKANDEKYVYKFAGWNNQVAETCVEDVFYMATYTKEFSCETDGHTLTDWIVDKPATTTEEGSQHKECTICGETIETETIEMLPETEESSSASQTSSNKNGVVGFINDYYGILIVVIVGIACVLLFVGTRKKSHRKR